MERADAKYLPLAAVGLAQGFMRYYARPELTAKRGWMAIAATVALVDLLGEQTLSSYSKERCATSPWLKLGIGAVALHLMSDRTDPWHLGTKVIKRL